MCFLALLYERVPNFPIVVAANRDEAIQRRGLPPREIRTGVWAGFDPKAGGTWLGINWCGRIAAVANRRTDSAADPEARSRGLLCLDLLRQEEGDRLVDWLRAEVAASSYNPFNLLMADASSAWVATFSRGSLESHTLGPGVHVIGNTLPGNEKEPKVLRGQTLIRTDADIDGALGMLSSVCRDHGIAPHGSDAICVHGASHATLSSTLLAVHDSGLGGSRYLHADGAPCASEYRDYGGFWG